MKPLFVFDLDSTITKCELLPLIAGRSGLGGRMARLTEEAMRGSAPFAEDFPRRVGLLVGIPVPEAQKIVLHAPLNGEIARFLRENPERCRIVTGNLDAWIDPLVESLSMQGKCMCSKAVVCGERLLGIKSILDKAEAVATLPHPFVAIGDGSNDIGMLQAADIGIAFGGVREPSEALIAVADMVVRDEKELIQILQKLL